MLLLKLVVASLITGVATAQAPYNNVSSSESVPPVSLPSPIWPSTSYTTMTTVVTELVTYCPSPTTITTNGETITVTAPTTLTITACPCTVTTSIPVEPTNLNSTSWEPQPLPSGTPIEEPSTGVPEPSHAETTTGEFPSVTSTVLPTEPPEVIPAPNGANMATPALLGIVGIAICML